MEADLAEADLVSADLVCADLVGAGLRAGTACSRCLPLGRAQLQAAMQAA
jgi:uncharacterized protein YjbI with pentapeptide repeats